MRGIRKSIAVVLLLSLPVLAGCVVAAVGAGAAGVAYVKGKATKVYSAPMDLCIEGVRLSLTDLGMKIVKEKGDKLSYTFVCRTGEDTDVEVKLKSVNTDSTEIAVRFGVFGDKKKSARLHEEFAKHIEKK